MSTRSGTVLPQVQGRYRVRVSTGSGSVLTQGQGQYSLRVRVSTHSSPATTRIQTDLYTGSNQGLTCTQYPLQTPVKPYCLGFHPLVCPASHVFHVMVSRLLRSPFLCSCTRACFARTWATRWRSSASCSRRREGCSPCPRRRRAGSQS